MKIVLYGPDRRVGAIRDGNIVDLNWAYAKYLRETQGAVRPYAHADAAVPADLEGFITEGPRAIEGAQQALEYQATRNPDPLGARGERIVHGPETKIHPPLAHGGVRIAMAGGNYADHLRGFRVNRMHQEVTLQQVYDEARAAGCWGFWKLSATVIGPEEDMLYPARTQRLDYECEVVVVLGKSGHDIPEGRASDYFWGYTLLNDWSIRDDAGPARPLSFNLAKNYDTSCSLGPCIVVGEIADPQNIDFETRVDGELRQRGNTRDMVFSFAEFLAYLSRDTTFRPGEMISGGTCAGTAADASEYDASGVPAPTLFLRPGQVVELSSPQIGMLRNRVVSRPSAR